MSSSKPEMLKDFGFFDLDTILEAKWHLDRDLWDLEQAFPESVEDLASYSGKSRTQVRRLLEKLQEWDHAVRKKVETDPDLTIDLDADGFDPWHEIVDQLNPKAVIVCKGRDQKRAYGAAMYLREEGWLGFLSSDILI